MKRFAMHMTDAATQNAARTDENADTLPDRRNEAVGNTSTEANGGQSEQNGPNGELPVRICQTAERPESDVPSVPLW